MKQMEVRKVPYGEAFSVYGDTFIALDYINGNVLALRKEIWKNAPFDTGGVNDLRTASITGHLVEYFLGLCKQGASEDTVAMNMIDLKATDGTKEYGTFGMRAGLLTLEQYGKYQDIIPLADNWWWLATPWRTPNPGGSRSPYLSYSASSWCCDSNGYCGHANYCTFTYGIRPALLFTSSLLVSYQDEEGENGGMTEKAIYEAYLEYVHNWAEEAKTDGAKESPMNYDEWLVGFNGEGHDDAGEE